MHNVFHISMLRKYEPDPSHVLDWGDLTINEDVTYEERPIRVLDSRYQVLREKNITLVKVLGFVMVWRKLRGSASPRFVLSIWIFLMHWVHLSNFVDDISLSGGGCKISKFSFISMDN